MNTKPSTAGFTLIEMIVSLALFSVVITISVGALLILIASNRQLQDEQAVLTNLSFALDSMTREIRTGSAYVCGSESNRNGNNNIFRDGQNLDSISVDTEVDCINGRNRNSGVIAGNAQVHGLSFVEGGDSITGSANQRIVYFHDIDPDGDNGTEDGALYRRVGTGAAQKITSNSVAIVDADFFVTGAEPLSAAPGAPAAPSVSQVTQPTVTIYIEAQVAGATNPKTYPIQTTVVQRTVDL
jgi:prepilin-type N-terminal cleavage/methylation domain-containing protein